MKAPYHSTNLVFVAGCAILFTGCIAHEIAPVPVYSAPPSQTSPAYSYSNQTPYQPQPGVTPPPFDTNVPPSQAEPAPANAPVATQAPPPIQTEVTPPSPGPGYYWAQGHWYWRANSWVWMNGSWIIQPRPGAVWVGEHWVHRRWGWVWVEGGWRY